MRGKRLDPSLVDLARDHLAAGRPLTLDAQGHSMWPLIQHGDRVVVQPLPTPPTIGDIVLIVLSQRLVLHRVIAVSSRAITTKGDAVARPDQPLAHDAILGVLPRVAPTFNRLCAHLSTHAGRPLAAVLQRLRMALDRTGVA